MFAWEGKKRDLSWRARVEEEEKKGLKLQWRGGKKSKKKKEKKNELKQ